MDREQGVGRVEIMSGALDGAEGVLERLYWEDGVQYAEVRLEDGQRLTMEIMRREIASEAAQVLPRELGS